MFHEKTGEVMVLTWLNKKEIVSKIVQDWPVLSHIHDDVKVHIAAEASCLLKGVICHELSTLEAVDKIHMLPVKLVNYPLH